MRDLTQYSDNELSLNVFNDEYFYIERNNMPFLNALINEEFIYTTTQLLTLYRDLNEVSK